MGRLIHVAADGPDYLAGESIDEGLYRAWQEFNKDKGHKFDYEDGAFYTTDEGWKEFREWLKISKEGDPPDQDIIDYVENIRPYVGTLYRQFVDKFLERGYSKKAIDKVVDRLAKEGKVWVKTYDKEKYIEQVGTELYRTWKLQGPLPKTDDMPHLYWQRYIDNVRSPNQKDRKVSSDTYYFPEHKLWLHKCMSGGVPDLRGFQMYFMDPERGSLWKFYFEVTSPVRMERLKSVAEKLFHESVIEIKSRHVAEEEKRSSAPSWSPEAGEKWF